MNKDNAKDYLPFVQALAEGKTIQQCDRDEWIDMKDPCFCEDVRNYRIKPEVKYVPFDTTEELINYWNQKMFSGKPYNTILEMPLIWVKNKETNSKFLITGIEGEGDSVSLGGYYYSIKEMFDIFTFLDDSPIGKIKE